MAAKLRFREADKSLEVYDIDIWLSCDDVWVGLVTQDTTNTLGRLWSPDYVIVNSSTEQFAVTQANNGVDPVTGALIGRSFLPSRVGLSNERSLVGYFEVIGEERTVCKATLLKDAAITTVDRLFDANARERDVPNQLTGYAYLVRVIDGVAMGYNATAIANFSRTQGSLFDKPGSENPDLSWCEDTIDQLEFELSKAVFSQGYSVESSIAAKFSAVVTFPTKHFHFAVDPPFSLNANTGTTYGRKGLPGPIFGEPWTAATANNSETISLTIWDRNENPFSPPPGFESPPVESGKLGLPFEVNIIGLYPVSGTPTLTNPRDNIGFGTGGFDSGWFLMDFPNGKCLPDGNNRLQAFNFWGNFFYQYIGLPAIGLAVQEFFNGHAGGAYGEILPLFYYQNVNAVCVD